MTRRSTTQQAASSKWYIVHTYSGFEERVKETLRQRADALGMGDAFGEIRIPTETIVELQGRQEARDAAQVLPRLHPGRDGDVRRDLARGEEHAQGDRLRRHGQESRRRSPQEEVNQILEQVVTAKEKPKPKYVFEKGEPVKIIDGPFNNFTGVVEEVNLDRNTLKVMVTIFGRQTPVELEFLAGAEAAKAARGRGEHGEESRQVRSSCRSRRARRPRRRRWARRSVRPASTSWTSARRSTPARRTQQGLIIPVVITVYADRSYTFITKTPPASILLLKAAGVEKGSGVPNRNKVGKVTKKQVEEIAKTKMPDLNAGERSRRRCGSSRAPRARWASTWPRPARRTQRGISIWEAAHRGRPLGPGEGSR